MTNALGYEFTANYCTAFPGVGGCRVSPLQSFTMPEGNSRNLTYDAYQNVITTTNKAKTGTTPMPPDIVTTASFNCATVLLCGKPTYTRDALTNQTDYTYSSVHGGVLTATLPAVGGIRPQTRYTYTQKYAWISNGAGGYVQAATPIWLLTQESFCKEGTANISGTGCAIAGDEVVTTYDYGPNSGPNTLLLRGKVVDAGTGKLNLRTCYGYDNQGNKISETEPKAGLGNCP